MSKFKDMKFHQDFKVGSKVKVYSVMYPRRMYKGTAEIERIASTSPKGEELFWLKGEVSGAWHPDACELLELN